MSNHINTQRIIQSRHLGRLYYIVRKKKMTFVSPTFSEKSTHSKPHIQTIFAVRNKASIFEDESGCLLSPISN